MSIVSPFRRHLLRRVSTDAERHLWHALRASQLGAKLRRQHSIDAYVVDFYCAEVRVAVELDGDHHGDDAQAEHDARRTLVLEGHGVVVLRFTNVEALTKTREVLEEIARVIASRRG